MKRKTRIRISFLQSSLGFRLTMLILIALSTAGFIHFGAIAAYDDRHYGPDMAHPWDFYADGCLAVGLCAVGAILLTLKEQPIRGFKRLSSGRAWKLARNPAQKLDGSRSAARRRRLSRESSGYNKANDD